MTRRKGEKVTMRRYRSWSFRAIKTSAQDFKRCKSVGIYTA